MHTYELVEKLLISLGMENLYCNSRKAHLRDNFPELYEEIMLYTKDLVDPPFVERLYCYTNKIQIRPICKICSNNVRYSPRKSRGYFIYCNGKCAMKDMPTKLGVDNPSQLQRVKDKKKAKSLEVYKVDNVSKSEDIKKVLKEKRIEYWVKIHSIEKDDTTIKNELEKSNYYKLCHAKTEKEYNKHKNIIDPYSLRSKDWHLDHIFSIIEGFNNHIPAHIIADISNLRIISANDNLRKHASSHKTLQELCEAQGIDYTIYLPDFSYQAVIDQSGP